MINSKGTFMDTNLGIKKKHDPIKTVAIIKAKRNSQIIINFLKMTLNSETRVEAIFFN